jgi:cytidyltransferase-like protein
MKPERVIVVSGGFDPLHSGHIAYFNSAIKLGDFLVVALNSDNWLIKKKGKFFMPFSERFEIISNLKMVNEVIGFDDDEHGTCKDALEKIKLKYRNSSIVFCNGGDRSKENIPEMDVAGIEFKFCVGGKVKKNSSSWILKDYKYESENRMWGKFFNLYFEEKVKIKELIIFPNKGISYQRHFHRSEVWFVKKGECILKSSQDSNNPDIYNNSTLKIQDTVIIKKGTWHQVYNVTNQPCHIIEIQYGEVLDESDIERLSFYEHNED